MRNLYLEEISGPKPFPSTFMNIFQIFFDVGTKKQDVRRDRENPALFLKGDDF